MAQPPLSEMNDEQIISWLEDYLPGRDLPENVLEDSSPFVYPPSSLPEGMWYVVKFNEKKESDHGFWKAKGEACNVYSNGWKTTLEYFEGSAPDGQITDWLMQEYMIAPNQKYKLCRIFLCKIIIQQDAGGKEAEETFADMEFDEADCIARGDFLELNDLESHSSSSLSSNVSEEYFGSSAFLRELENNLKQEDELVLQPVLPADETSSGDSSLITEAPYTTITTSKNADSVPSDENKGGAASTSTRKNKFRTYFCFSTF